MLILGLYVYEFAWAFLLLKVVRDSVIPLLHRFPSGLSEYASRLFWAEGEFVLTRTTAANHYLLLLLALVLLRMGLTPFIRAGLFHAVHQAEKRAAGWRFFPGIRKLGKPFAMIYGAQMILTIGPLVWLYFRFAPAVMRAEQWSALLPKLLPYVAGFLLYAALIQLLATLVQLGKTTGHGPMLTVMVLLRCAHIAAAIAAVIALVSIFAYALISATSYVWAGLFAIIAHFAHQLVRIVLNVWRLSAQYHIWSKYVR